MNHDYICLLNPNYEKSLTIGTLYVSLPDDSVKNTDLIRVVDNTGESALYPRKLFAIAT